MSQQNFEIRTLPNYWLKHKFTVAIFDTRDTNRITSGQYRQLAEEAIKTWNQTLTEFSTAHPEHAHLSNVRFTISEQITGNEDIQIRWWFSNPLNGLTCFLPCHARADNGVIYVAKCNGPDIPAMPDTNSLRQLGAAPIVRGHDQIRSIIIHEFGHILTLGHSNFWRDLMMSDTPQQPDPRRRISNIDMRIISDSFNPNFQTRINNSDQLFHFTEDEWQNVEANIPSNLHS